LKYKAKTRRKRPSWIRIRLGFYLPSLYVDVLENNPETPPSPIKGWEGEPRRVDAFPPPYTSVLESSSAFHLSARSNLRHRYNTSIVATSSIKSDKQDVGLYPTRGPNLGKTCVSLCRLIAIEFAGSHKRSMSRKPSSMGIARGRTSSLRVVRMLPKLI
jgi:hypothetical protein